MNERRYYSITNGADDRLSVFQACIRFWTFTQGNSKGMMDLFNDEAFTKQVKNQLHPNVASTLK